MFESTCVVKWKAPNVELLTISFYTSILIHVINVYDLLHFSWLLFIFAFFVTDISAYIKRVCEKGVPLKVRFLVCTCVYMLLYYIL